MVGDFCSAVYVGCSRLYLIAVEHVIDPHTDERLEVVAVVDPSSCRRNRIVQSRREPMMRVGDGRIVKVSADKQVGRLLIVDVLIDLLDLLSTTLESWRESSTDSLGEPLGIDLLS